MEDHSEIYKEFIQEEKNKNEWLGKMIDHRLEVAKKSSDKDLELFLLFITGLITIAVLFVILFL